jgi:hypothetical protein
MLSDLRDIRLTTSRCRPLDPMYLTLGANPSIPIELLGDIRYTTLG